MLSAGHLILGIWIVSLICFSTKEGSKFKYNTYTTVYELVLHCLARTYTSLVPRPCRRRKKWPGYETTTVAALLDVIVNSRHTHSSPIFLLACRRGTAAVAPPPCLGESLLLPFVRPFVCLLQARGSGLPFHFQWRSWEEEEEEKGKEEMVYGVHVARQCSEGQGGCYGDEHNLTWDTSLS